MYDTVTVRQVLAEFDGQPSVQANAVIASAGLGENVQVEVLKVVGVPHVLFIQPTSVHACASAVATAVDEETIPERAASAAAWVIVDCAPRISPYVMIP